MHRIKPVKCNPKGNRRGRRDPPHVLTPKHAIAIDDVYPETSDAGLPPPGLSAPCAVRGVIECHRLLVDIDGTEIELVLVGLDPPAAKINASGDWHPVALAARNWIAGAIDAAGNCGRHHVYLPRPRHSRGWIQSLRPNSRHAGLLYLAGDAMSLNARAAASNLVDVVASCRYLSPNWNRSAQAPPLRAAA